MDMESPRRRQSSDRTQPLGRSSGGVPAQASSDGAAAAGAPASGGRSARRARHEPTGTRRFRTVPHRRRPARAPEAGPSLADWLRTPRPEAQPGIWRFGHRPRPPEEPDRISGRQLLSGAVIAFLVRLAALVAALERLSRRLLGVAAATF